SPTFPLLFLSFFFNHTAHTVTYPLSLHDALPICRTPQINSNGGRDHWGAAGSLVFAGGGVRGGQVIGATDKHAASPTSAGWTPRSEEHTSELQSLTNLVCRLLLEKKKH